MWCEDFLSAYRNTPVGHISKYYDRLSVFVEATADGRWTEPATGAHKIAERLAALSVSAGCGWPVVTCQRTRSDGLIVMLASEDGLQHQILIAYWRVVGRRAIVSNHFYLNTAADGELQDDDLVVSSFHSRFEGWARRLDRGSLFRFQTALHTGLTLIRDHYATLPGRPAERLRYDRAARFSYTRADGSGGGRVYIGSRAIRKQYDRLVMDNRSVRLRVVETCWSGYNDSIPGTTVALIAGVVPKVGRASAYREFVQLFVVDVHTRKIVNDVLCFEPPRRVSISSSPRVAVSSSSSSNATSSAFSQPPSSSSKSKLPSQQSQPLPFSYAASTSSSNNQQYSYFYSCASSCSDSSLSNQIDVRFPTTSTSVSNENNDENRFGFATLRSCFMVNILGIRIAAICSPCASTVGTGCGSSGHLQQNVTSSKVNPRQLFIGCVPLHVKYEQLKLLFERFGEVTFVKVYEGYNKQTGAKMLHNYAFLFFKDEKSVEKAIAASPIPLDSNWNLNVSRPHHHTTTVGASDR
ncbi:unnamed protein product [Aphis gossypii]|uniref:RRM domain-containing protein n=1 Tax=Aphis gossypii TaxID=80765 RepID=A0A9P0NPZ1_APHGO|nr:unnamed protein product [Aphis gossypii]